MGGLKEFGRGGDSSDCLVSNLRKQVLLAMAGRHHSKSLDCLLNLSRESFYYSDKRVPIGTMEQMLIRQGHQRALDNLINGASVLSCDFGDYPRPRLRVLLEEWVRPVLTGLPGDE